MNSRRMLTALLVALLCMPALLGRAEDGVLVEPLTALDAFGTPAQDWTVQCGGNVKYELASIDAHGKKELQCRFGRVDPLTVTGWLGCTMQTDNPSSLFAREQKVEFRLRQLAARPEGVNGVRHHRFQLSQLQPA